MDGRRGPRPGFRHGSAVGFLLLAAGCYTLHPVTGPAPTVGTVVGFDVNDAGRVALGGTLGPEVARIEGRLLEATAEDYLLAVSSLKLLRGGEQVWRGEQVRVRREHLGNVYERRFSAGRTIALTGTVIGATALFFATRSLLGAGQSNDSTPVDSADTRVGRP